MLTDCIMVKSLPDKSEDTVVSAYLKEQICRFKGSRKILSDNGCDSKTHYFQK